MLTGSFEFLPDPDHKLLRIKFLGHWSIETVSEYANARRRILLEMVARGCALNDLLVLIDRRDQSVQSQDVVNLLQLLVGNSKTHRARRTAVVVTGALHRRQVDRISSNGAAKVFDNTEEALAWLQH